ncbi:MAG TPA: hypothetical protein DDY71_06660, partial [Spirochaetia bacterium]|nr:hypothetical protein [Spirochaetia bacterium]HBI37311.1 hypothetical protein [Spirochaetia bacterium]
PMIDEEPIKFNIINENNEQLYISNDINDTIEITLPEIIEDYQNQPNLEDIIQSQEFNIIEPIDEQINFSAEIFENISQNNQEEKEENESAIEQKSIENAVDLKELFEEKYHRILFYLKRTISSNPNITLSIIKVKITNGEQLELELPNFKIDTFISDVQFIVMNIVGTDGLVSMFNDFSIYAILPEVDSSNSKEILNRIVEEIEIMFSEIFGSSQIDFENKIVNYPDDSDNFIELFFLAQNA